MGVLRVCCGTKKPVCSPALPVSPQTTFLLLLLLLIFLILSFLCIVDFHVFALSSNSQFHPMYRRSLPYMGPPRGWHGHAGPPHGPPYYNHHLHAYDAYWVSLSCVWAAAPYPCRAVRPPCGVVWSDGMMWWVVQ